MRKFPRSEVATFRIFKKLSTPGKVQGFLNALRPNREERGETCRSPVGTLLAQRAHCMEGALLAAAALWYHGRPPLIMNLATLDEDTGHVVALYKERGRWGAVSKTNHAVLRFRDPVYKTSRELAMSFFHEYFLDDGKKTLREYSAPFDLSRQGSDWLTASYDLWDVDRAFLDSRHFPVASKEALGRLRRADPVEREAGKIVEWR